MPRSLEDLARQTIAEAEALVEDFARELSVVIRDLERQIRPLITEIAEGNRTAIAKASQANRLRRDLTKLLDNAGYGYLVDRATTDRLNRLTTQVLRGRRLAGLSAELSRGAELRVMGLQATAGLNLLSEGAEMTRALWNASVRGVFNTASVNEILADLEDELDYWEPNLRTLYDTTTSIYSRQVEAIQAGDDPETRFLYAGPADSKTRPFCAQLVGKVLTRREINDLDNGQLDNPFLTGGGYNCRHVWMEVSAVSELAA